MILTVAIIIPCHLPSITLRVMISSVNNVSDAGTSKARFEKDILALQSYNGKTLNCFTKSCLLGISVPVLFFFFHFCLAAVSVSPLGIK